MKLFINDVESELTIIDKIALSLGLITLLVMIIAFVIYTLPIALPFILAATVIISKIRHDIHATSLQSKMAAETARVGSQTTPNK
jgi:hypothetical protein